MGVVRKCTASGWVRLQRGIATESCIVQDCALEGNAERGKGGGGGGGSSEVAIARGASPVPYSPRPQLCFCLYIGYNESKVILGS